MVSFQAPQTEQIRKNHEIIVTLVGRGGGVADPRLTGLQTGKGGVVSTFSCEKQ